jgi:toxin-antitoxin system PIN domain toxin
MKVALLDVNVLLALAWPNHQHHTIAHNWFSTQSRNGWASCALTQLAFIRLSANPAYTANAVSPQEAAALLAEFIQHKHHRFWSSPPATSPNIYSHALGHQQVTDAYLATIARHQKGRLVSFDARTAAHAPEIVDLIPSIPTD